ncbi:hypothetical protein GCM10011326_46400 [Salipiger profundus]|uniref:Tripartite ATP-independent transporter, DctM component n=1 Tax=Salipiger profundus TaxID=1229727 RepID=A0A1U7DD85_9RHOB|nr:Tripartite ATP-independent transporter, DctM component [Salipiger profundus]GGA29129.1 hypothetical protein GCM10011326_46400 [Salipiger profundus]
MSKVPCASGALRHEHGYELPVIPFGPAAFYLKSVAPPEISLADILKALVPFICIKILALALLIAFPEIATWWQE